MAGENGQDFGLLNLCLEYCQQFNNKSSFNFLIKFGALDLTVKHSEIKETSAGKTVKKKYTSPSTKRRNAARLFAFKAKRAEMGGRGPTRSGDPPP